MGKKNKGNWQRNLPLSSDTSPINTAHHFVPEDFDYIVPAWLVPYIDMEKVERLGWNPPQYAKELVCKLLNYIRIEYVCLRNNGEPKHSYKQEVAEKILSRKEPRLERKKMVFEKILEATGMELKPDFDRLDKNLRPRFEYKED